MTKERDQIRGLLSGAVVGQGMFPLDPEIRPVCASASTADGSGFERAVWMWEKVNGEIPSPGKEGSWSYRMYLEDLRRFLKSSTCSWKSGTVYTPFGVMKIEQVPNTPLVKGFSDQWKERVWGLTTDIYWSLKEEWVKMLRHSSLLRLHNYECFAGNCPHKFDNISQGDFAACFANDDVAAAYRIAHFAWNGENDGD